MARQIEMEVSIDTTKSEIKLQKLQNELKQLRKEAAQLDEGDKGFGAWAEAINQTENEMLQLKNSIKSNNVETSTSTKNFQSLGDRISSAFDGAGKKARRFTLALFSVRSAFSIISKASQSYLSQNEDTSNKIAGAWSYLGNVIGPVIEKIVSWLQYGIAYLNVFLKSLTGVDFLAKSIQKSTAKVNKELKKTVSSMDEIVNLDLDSGSNAPNGAGALQDIADLELNPKVVEFMEKLGNAIKTVWEWAKTAWNFLEEHFGTTGALAIVAGLALIIGSATSGGLLGVLAALTAIAAVELTEIIKQLDELDRARKQQHEDEAKAIASKIALYNYYKQQYQSATTEAERAEYLGKMKSSYEDMVSLLEDYNGKLDNAVDLGGTLGEYWDNSKTLSENVLSTTKDVSKEINGLEGTTVKAKIKIGADLTEAEKDTMSWWDRTMLTIKYGWNRFWENFSISAFLKGKTGMKQYATGGFPNEGQMFIANEKGPELVGNIGNSTAVVNNNQIVESVSQGVAMAVSSVMGSNKSNNQNATYLYINGSEFAKAVYDDMNSESRRRNANTSIRRA